MKSSRATRLVLATAFVATASLLIASPASAATTVGDGIFYNDTDFGVEGATYPTGFDWFFGDAAGVDGPHAFTAAGLELNTDATGNVQILNQNVGVQPTSAADLIAMVDTFSINSVDDNTWALQLAFFGEGASSGQYTTLYPNTLGNITPPSSTSTWFTTGALGPYAAGSTATLEQLANELFVGEAPTLLAYGAFVVASNTAVIHDIEWRDNHSFFMPVPTRAISTPTITVAAASTTGFTLTGTNWGPGNDVFINIVNSNGDPLFTSDTLTADSSGNVSVPVVLTAPVALGTYTVTFDDNGFFYSAGVFGDPFTTFEVIAAAPVVAPAPQLAATGVSESGPYFAGAAGLLALMGVAAVVVSRRRMNKI